MVPFRPIIINSYLQIQAAASVRQSQVAAVTATQAAIAIVGSIIGSSLLSIFAYFLLTRYRRNKDLQRRQEYDDSRGGEKSRRNSEESYYPRSRRGSEARSRRGSESRSRRGSEARSRRGSDAANNEPMPRRATRRDLAIPLPASPDPGDSAKAGEEDRTQVKTPRSARPVLIYDPDNPTRPPTFVSREDGNVEDDESFSSFYLEKITDDKSQPPLPKNKKGWIGTAV